MTETGEDVFGRARIHDSGLIARQSPFGFVEPCLLCIYILAGVQAGDEIADESGTLARRQPPRFFLYV